VAQTVQLDLQAQSPEFNHKGTTKEEGIRFRIKKRK
jgi:hypothetical protein